MVSEFMLPAHTFHHDTPTPAPGGNSHGARNATIANHAKDLLLSSSPEREPPQSHSPAVDVELSSSQPSFNITHVSFDEDMDQPDDRDAYHHQQHQHRNHQHEHHHEHEHDHSVTMDEDDASALQKLIQAIPSPERESCMFPGGAGEERQDEGDISLEERQDLSKDLANLSLDASPSKPIDRSASNNHRHLPPDRENHPTIELDEEDVQRLDETLEKQQDSSISYSVPHNDPLGLYSPRPPRPQTHGNESPHAKVVLPSSPMQPPAVTEESSQKQEPRTTATDSAKPIVNKNLAHLMKPPQQFPATPRGISPQETFATPTWIPPPTFQTPAANIQTTMLGFGSGSKSSPAAYTSEYPGMLAEVRKECQHLRQLNDRLMQANEEARRALELAAIDKDKALIQLRNEFTKNLEAVENAATRKMQEYEAEIGSLRSNLHAARSSQTQISVIREALEKDKELDVLAIKKEIASQKERQLHALRDAMAQDKQELQRRMRAEIDQRESVFKDLQKRMEEELDQCQRTIAQLREKIQPAKYTATVDVQTEEAAEDLVTTSIYNKISAELLELQSERESLREDLQSWKSKEEQLLATVDASRTRLEHFQAVVDEKDKVIEDLRRALAWRGAKIDRAISTDEVGTFLERPTETRDMISREEHQQQLNKRVSEVKKQCTVAYEDAVQQMKQEFKRLEKRLKERHEQELEKYRQEIEEEVLQEKELQLDHHEKVKQLELKISDMNKNHRKELHQLETKLQSHYQEAMQKMKKQYLDTLRQMRDDVASSKQRSLERVKVEWEHKKEALEVAWKNKLAKVREEYEQKLGASRTAPATSRHSRPVMKSSVHPSSYRKF